MINRRDFSAGLLAAGAVPLVAQAQARVPQDGNEYKTLDKVAPVDVPKGKIEVVEFFWYSCPHCNAFEPQLEAWSRKLPADVVLRRAPVAFRDSFVPQQRLFYTLEAMGKLPELHPKVFETIHVQRLAVDREESILDWVQKNGVDRAKFQEVYNSFSVQTKTRRAAQLQDAYKVEGVPALGIAGRFYTDGTLAANMQRALQVTEHLVDQIRRGK